MHFTYMEFNSVHAFKAQMIAFRENPRKRAGMHPDSEFGLQKHQLIYKDFHSFSRNHINQHKIRKMGGNNDSDRIIEIPCEKLGVLGTKKVRGALVL